MTIIDVGNGVLDSTKFYCGSYRMTRSGMDKDPWAGYVVELTGNDEPVVKGLHSAKEADRLAWELNINNGCNVPSYALKCGLLSSFSIIPQSEVMPS
jgi:hypothetical protein